MNKKKIKSPHSQRRELMYDIIFWSVVLIIAGSVLYMTLHKEPTDNSNNSTGTDNQQYTTYGKWLFAMDTAGVGTESQYNTGYIPTLVIIDSDGNIVFRESGVHTKEQLLQYIDSAEDGTLENLGVAPDFTLTTFNDETFKLSEQRGKVVLLDFMADYCEPCKLQMPKLQEVKEELGDNIVILSIDIAYPQETENMIRESFGKYILE